MRKDPMRTTLSLTFLVVAANGWAAPRPLVLTNHLGYEPTGPKRAVVQGHPGDEVRSCAVEDLGGSAPPLSVAPVRVGPVVKWRDWVYWTVDFSSLTRAGTYRIACATAASPVVSSPFAIERLILERSTLSNVVYYFKGQRSSGALDDADRSLPLEGQEGRRVDLHGGWYDATGDYGKHLSHLSYSTYFNPQQLPLTTWGLFESYELLLRRGDPDFRQYLRRILDEASYGAAYLLRDHVPNGSFYRSVDGPGRGKRPADRRVGRDAKGMAIKSSESGTSFASEAAGLDDLTYESSLRAGGGVAIAALARASVMAVPIEARPDYLRAAEEAWAFLAANNPRLLNDGRENIVDDYCGLLSATELYRATSKDQYKQAADERATRLVGRLQKGPPGYWRADDGTRPFFHAADAGLPVVALLNYMQVGDAGQQAAVRSAVRESLASELATTREVANPFGYARQVVQGPDGSRHTRFFFPHDSEAAPWWQGEDARLASLAFAARLGEVAFEDDPAFVGGLRRYADDQLNWILGLNPFDASLLQGSGRNNPEYLFFGSYEYTNAPGGIVNGITSGFRDPDGIDFNLPHTVTGADHDWRWGEQWLPHATWYLLAVAAGSKEPAPKPPAAGRVIIGYLFPQEKLVDPAEIAADKLTHINYAFADVKDGRVVEGFAHDRENFEILAGIRTLHPHLKILVSVGGWTWSGRFSDAALTEESRRVFVESAVQFVKRHDLDGFDVDWEYPGLRGLDNVHRPEDKENFTALMAALRAGLDALGALRHRHYVLSFAAGASSDFLEHTEMSKVQASVDFVNLMAYDYREADSEPVAGHHAPLYAATGDPKEESASRSIGEFLRAGVPPGKLVLGVPFYGHTWGGVKDENRGLWEPGGAPKERLETHYASLAEQLVNKGGFVRYWDTEAQAPYLWNREKRLFVTYEDRASLVKKCEYIRERGLAGAMFWEYYADPSGALLSALDAELRGGRP
jgi:GH18 family chitinase